MRHFRHTKHFEQLSEIVPILVATKLVTILDYSFRAVLLVLELATPLTAFVGFPTVPIVFTWIIDKKVRETAVDIPLPYVNIVRKCVALYTPFLLLVLWVALPYYSVRNELYPTMRGVIFCLFG